MTKSLIVAPLCAGLLLCGAAIAQTNGNSASTNGANAGASNGARAAPGERPKLGAAPNPNGPYAQDPSPPNSVPTDGPGTTPKSGSTPSAHHRPANRSKRLSSAAGDPNHRNGSAAQHGTNGNSRTQGGTFNASPPSTTSYPSESNPDGPMPNAKPGSPVGPVPPGAKSVKPNSGAGSRTEAADGVPSNRGNHVLPPAKDDATGKSSAGANPAGTAGGR